MPVAETQVESVPLETNRILAALLAVLTNWERAEVRQGRRGEYRTTGASLVRIRALDDEKEIEAIRMVTGLLGMDIDDDDLEEIFSGDFEYQVSYACNRFPTAGSAARVPRLTQNETRTLQRASTIIASKGDAALRIFDTPGRKAA